MEKILIQKNIVEILKPLNPYLVILFGSYANGEPHRDSDIDIFVVLNNRTMPKTFKEKQTLYLSVSKYTRQIAKQTPLDLMVFTIPMYEHFKAGKSSFSKEIFNKGIILYETNDKTMA